MPQNLCKTRILWPRNSNFPSTPVPHMGVPNQQHAFLLSFLNLILFASLLSFFAPLLADADSISAQPPSTSSTSTPSPPPNATIPQPQTKPNASPVRPGIAVIVGVLTTMFSLTFLLLLYAKHCKHNRNGYGVNGDPNGRALEAARKNSGIDRAVVESLPVFRFSSLRGQKEGLECAVCLTRFEGVEVLRLLPKCKHAFHVECLDTWLDAHSTCPLCRYRVDPEDVLLIQDYASSNITPAANNTLERQPQQEEEGPDLESGRGFHFHRTSGRHSSAGEKVSGLVQPSCHTPSLRRSLDSSSLRKKKEAVGVGCFERQRRKDGLLLPESDGRARFEHRIVVSGGLQQRWSDVQPSDLLYLRSEMIMNETHQLGSGRSAINPRSVSEITGCNRFSSRASNEVGRRRQRQAGVVTRWLAWLSSRSQPSVRTEHANAIVVA